METADETNQRRTRVQPESAASDFPEALQYVHPGLRIHFWEGIGPRSPAKRTVGHWHDEFELVLAEESPFSVLVNGVKRQVEEGGFVLVNGGQIHKVDMDDSARYRFLMLLVHPSVLGCEPALRQSAVEPMRRRMGVLPYATLRKDETGKIPEIFRTIRDLEAAPGPDAPLRLAGLSFRLWAEVMEILRAKGTFAGAAPGGEPAPDSEFAAVREMASFVRERYGGPLTLARIAAAGGVCRSRCCAMFARHMGQSPISYLNSYRLAVAARMLRESSAPVADVAYSCGFAHQ
ncbi:MAG: AraC family transcriptional regulator, partial [Kiritimatiellae bacterium]|nr:AraC family transcriptional regulator [Kiritimatiellia bacterium]